MLQNFCLWLTAKVLAVQLPAWGLWLLWQYVLQPYFFSKQPEVISVRLTCVHCAQISLRQLLHICTDPLHAHFNK